MNYKISMMLYCLLVGAGGMLFNSSNAASTNYTTTSNNYTANCTTNYNTCSTSNNNNRGCCNTGCTNICQKNCFGCTSDQDLFALTAPNAPCNTECGFQGPRCCLPRCAGVHSVFIPRSQGADTARELVGWQSILYGSNAVNYCAINQALEFSRSYRGDLITRYLFDRTDALTFTGSLIENRNSCDLLADYFGLAPDFKGCVHLDPHIENIYFDNQFFFSLESIACGLYARFHLPIVHTRWDLNACPVIESQGTTFPACYMATNPIKACSNLESALNGSCKFGALKEPLQFGKLDFKTQSLTRLADIDCIIGFNIIQNPLYHIGLYGQLVIPTGNKPDPHYIFSPIVGNGKHWELGIGLSAHRALVNLGPSSDISVYLEGNVTHMFKNHQVRSFDFYKQGALSRYMLLKEFEIDASTPTGRFIPAINITTLPVDVSVAVKGDFTLKFAYHDTCGLELDLGYNAYGNSPEDLKICSRSLCTNNRYGFKGTEGTCYLEYDTQGVPPVVDFGILVDKEPLNSTQSDARITYGGAIDNPDSAPLSGGADIAVAWNSAQMGNVNAHRVVHAQISAPPVLISQDLLNINSGAACGSFTHSIFSYIGYIKQDCVCENWIGNIGLGAKIEFQGEITNERRFFNGCIFEPQVIDRLLSSLNQWAIFIKGGISF